MATAVLSNTVSPHNSNEQKGLFQSFEVGIRQRHVSIKCIYVRSLDPVVQSIVSLTILLRHKFVKQISAKVTNTLLFFVEKM